jgi:hypothetical protein
MKAGLFSKTFKGLVFDFLEDGSYLLNYAEFSKNGNKLNPEKIQLQLNSITEIENDFKFGDIVQVHLLGKGIIVKTIEENDANSILEDEQLILKVLPNVEPSDFLISKYPVNNKLHVAICRKSLVDEILTLLLSNNCIPIHIYVGPNYLDIVLPFIENEKNIRLNSYNLEVDNKQIVTINRVNNIENTQQFNIENYSLSSNVLILLTSVLLLESKLNNYSVKHAVVQNQHKRVLFDISFKKYVIFSLLFFLSVLFINFIVYTYLYTKSVEYNINSSKLSKQTELRKLERELYSNNIAFLRFKAWNKPYMLSEYIECIVKMAPNGLNIQHLNYQLNNKENRKKVELAYNKIYISGQVINSNQLNKWIKGLSSLSQFKEVKLINYFAVSNSNRYSFNLEIQL